MSKWLPLNQLNLTDQLESSEPEGDAKSTKPSFIVVSHPNGTTFIGYVVRFGKRSLVIQKNGSEEYIQFVTSPWVFTIIAPPSDRQFGVAERELPFK